MAAFTGFTGFTLLTGAACARGDAAVSRPAPAPSSARPRRRRLPLLVLRRRGVAHDDQEHRQQERERDAGDDEQHLARPRRRRRLARVGELVHLVAVLRREAVAVVRHRAGHGVGEPLVRERDSAFLAEIASSGLSADGVAVITLPSSFGSTGSCASRTATPATSGSTALCWNTLPDALTRSDGVRSAAVE